MNRLTSSTSPYLLQHRDNPVDWWQWSPEAFAEAKRRDVPILLSVGYSACHWCHVMAHESFEDASTAAQMNASFINIKVDREERPDVDAVYMQATQAMTGQGGWPMTCLLTADGAPFFCGTYFPNAQFRQLLRAVSEAWVERRPDLIESGASVVKALVTERPAAAGPSIEDLDRAAAALVSQYDHARGGFGEAPKFPPSMVLEFLLRHYERTGAASSLAMVEGTGAAMARGGMYDQLAGGFARYSVDANWVVPHFEKMLYDNTLLLRFYLHWYRRTGSPLAHRVARETADFLLRDLRTEEGGFASALDADTEGVEGLTYAWTPAQLVDVLGQDDGPWAAKLLTVTDSGTFEDGASTLQLRAEPDDPDRWEAARARLLASRLARPQPGRDDKVVTAWNGLAIAGLAEAGVLLDEPAYAIAARDCARLLLSVHLVDGRLVRTSRDGRGGDSAGVSDDYGCLAEGLLVLHQVTLEPIWLSAAADLLDVALEHFHDGEHFFDTADDAETLIQRPWDPTDNASPSGQSALAAALLAYSALTGSSRHRVAAEQALSVIGTVGVQHPRYLGWALAAAEGLLDGPAQIAIVGDVGDMTLAAWRYRGPGAVVISGDPDHDGIELLAQRPLIGAGPTAYVCRGMVCDLPVTDTAALRQLLAS